MEGEFPLSLCLLLSPLEFDVGSIRSWARAFWNLVEVLRLHLVRLALGGENKETLHCGLKIEFL